MSFALGQLTVRDRATGEVIGTGQVVSIHLALVGHDEPARRNQQTTAAVAADETAIAVTDRGIYGTRHPKAP